MASLSKFLGFDAWWEGVSMGCPPVRSALPEPTARCDAGAICSQLSSKRGSSSLLLLLLLLCGVVCNLASTSCRPQLRPAQSSLVWSQATTCLELEFQR